jgi:hypothetical protein
MRASELESFRGLASDAAARLGVERWFMWAPSSLWPPLFRWGAVVAGTWFAYHLLLAVWLAWVRGEQRRILRHGKATGRTWGFWMFGLSLTTVTFTALLAAGVPWAELLRAWEGEDGAWLLASDVGGFGAFLLWLATKWFPPPAAGAPSAREA